jgi:hypothetical protein
MTSTTFRNVVHIKGNVETTIIHRSARCKKRLPRYSLTKTKPNKMDTNKMGSNEMSNFSNTLNGGLMVSIADKMLAVGQK